MDRIQLAKRPLGRTGLNVSALGLGTVKFGRNEAVKYPKPFDIPDENALADLLALARDCGINLLDTAPAYGQSEERLGRLLKGQRQNWIIAGKAGEEFEQGMSSHNFTPEHFKQSLTRTLKRLQTDYLDILLIHSDGRDQDILGDHELIEAMHDFKAKGLVRAIGASTKSAEGGLKALELFDVVMMTYNSAYTEETPVLEMAMKTHQGILVKKALGSGHQNPEESLRFALSHPGVSSAIIGSINPEHIAQNVQIAKNLTNRF